MQTMFVQSAPRGASELIEIPVALSASGRVTLPDVPQLRNQGDQVVVVKSLRLITPKVLSYGPVTGTVNMTLADLKKCSLVLYSRGWEKGHFIPLLVLNDAADNDSTAATTIPYRNEPTRLDDWKDVDWNKSYVNIANGQTIAAACVVILEVEYQVFQRGPGGQYKAVEVR